MARLAGDAGRVNIAPFAAPWIIVIVRAVRVAVFAAKPFRYIIGPQIQATAVYQMIACIVTTGTGKVLTLRTHMHIRRKRRIGGDR